MLVWAAVEDVRSGRIRNWLTLSLVWSGLLSSLLFPIGLTPMQSMLGLLAGLALPFAAFAMGALGGGDVKLLAGVGAWLGPMNLLMVFIMAAVVGMVVVLVQSLVQGRLAVLFRNSAVLLLNLWHVNDVGAAHLNATGKSCRSVDRPLPYAVPVLAATVLVVSLLHVR
jgi:prepilin peptidase CpaA